MNKNCQRAQITLHENLTCFSGVSMLALVLMILGTGYDYYLSRKVARKKNVIYDLEKHGKLDHFANSDQKVLNGKQFFECKSFFNYFFTCRYYYCYKLD